MHTWGENQNSNALSEISKTYTTTSLKIFGELTIWQSLLYYIEIESIDLSQLCLLKKSS